METHILKCPPSPALHDPAIQAAGAAIRRGQLVAMPTETVYGLAASALDPAACRSVFAAKQRPLDNPLIVHIAGLEMLGAVCDVDHVSPVEWRVMRALWPGPLTLLLPKHARVPAEVLGGADLADGSSTCPTVAVRMPAHQTALRLIEAAGVPLAAPSANLSGRPSPTCAQHVWHDLHGRIPFILDDGSHSSVGVESTVVDCRNRLVLRPGAVTLDDLRPFMPDIDYYQPARDNPASPATSSSPNHSSPVVDEERPPTPGMKYRHYSPSAPLHLLYSVQSPASVVAFVQNLLAEGKRVAWLTPFPIDNGSLENAALHVIPLSDGRTGLADAVAQMSFNLFAALRRADDELAVDVIVAEALDDAFFHRCSAAGNEGDTRVANARTPALMNRLAKAASHKHHLL